MTKGSVLAVAQTNLSELVQVWGQVRLGLALANAQLEATPISDMDIARLLEAPLSRARTKIAELVEAGRIEKIDGELYAACPEWAHWTVDSVIGLARKIMREVDG